MIPITDDLIARAQRALDELSSYDAAPLWEIVPELLDKLKAAQHTIERNQVALTLRERELEAARAENKRFKNWVTKYEDYARRGDEYAAEMIDELREVLGVPVDQDSIGGTE